jgi:hypothetical protein
VLKHYWIKLELFKGTLEDFAARHAAKTVNGLTFHPSLGNILCNDVHYYLMPMVHLLNLAEDELASIRLFDLLQTSQEDIHHFSEEINEKNDQYVREQLKLHHERG